jgi:hypothetical protein
MMTLLLILEHLLPAVAAVAEQRKQWRAEERQGSTLNLLYSVPLGP